MRRSHLGIGMAALLVFSLCWGQPASEPDPSPTNATENLAQGLRVEGVGRLPLGEGGEKQAYQAAVLDAYQQLLWQGAEHLGLVQDEARAGSRLLRLDEKHPHPQLMSWVLRSQPLSQQQSTSQLRVQMESPPLAELTAAGEGQVLRSLAFEVDGDQKPDSVQLTYDGRIRVVKSNGLVLATSPPLNVLSCHSLPLGAGQSWDQVQLTRVLSLNSLEAVSKDKLRLVAEVSLGESVDEYFVGRASEQREVMLRWDDPKGEPQIDISEPRDFFSTQKDKVAWKGLLRTPAGLLSAKLQVNGRPYWQTPERLTTQKLRMDILLPLLPGLNRAQVSLTDQSQRVVGREVLLYRQSPCPPPQPLRRKALLIGVSSYAALQFPALPQVQSDVSRLKQFLVRPEGGAFAAENVSVLLGSDATRGAILAKLREFSRVEGDERVLLFVYFAGLSAPTGGAGKGLLPYDARGFDEGLITPRELALAVGELRQQDLLLACDTSQGSLSGGSPESNWLDSQELADYLARQGWAVLASVDGPAAQRDGNSGSRFLSAFLDGCGAAADSNGDSYVEWDEAYRQLFQALRVSSPTTPSPLRRGELLGRVPLSRLR